MDKSYEQLAESYCRQIRSTRDKIIEDFYIAYAAQLSEFETVDLQSICLVEKEPHMRDGKLTRRYWFEYKPIFDNK